MDARHARGRAAEQLACDYLQAQGLTLLARNVSYRGGEIDLVMRDGNSLVFVEVRFRKNRRYGHAAETVDYRKQQRLLLAAQNYLQRHDPGGRLASRFDVIALHNDCPDDIDWIQNAFSA